LGKQWGLLDNEYKGADSCLNDSGNNRKNRWLMQDYHHSGQQFGSLC